MFDSYRETIALASNLGIKLNARDEHRINTALSVGMVNPNDILRYAIGTERFDEANG